MIKSNIIILEMGLTVAFQLIRVKGGKRKVLLGKVIEQAIP